MNYDAAQFIFNIITFSAMVLVSIQSHLTRKHAATLSSIDRVEKNLEEKIKSQSVIFVHSDEHIKNRMEMLGNRLTGVEVIMTKTPTHQDLGNIHDKMNEFIGEFKETRGEFKHVTRNMERLYQLNSEKHDELIKIVIEAITKK